MGDVALVAAQVRYENRSFWRNPPAAFFTIVFPLMFLVIVNAVYGDERLAGPDGRIVDGSTLYVAMIATFSIVTACFTNLAMSLTYARDTGRLKRLRATPLPPHVYLAARVVHSSLLAGALVAMTVAAGVALYGVDVPTGSLPAIAVAVAAGSASFAALGIALSSFVPNAHAAPAVVNGIVLPLFFASGVFLPASELPALVSTVAEVAPVKNLGDVLARSFNVTSQGPGVDVTSLAVVVAWGIAGLVIALRTFSWEPRR